MRGNDRGNVLAAWAWRLIRGAHAGAGRAGGPLRVWLLWEALTLRVSGVRPVRDGGLLGLSIARHRGAPVTLADGTRVERGATILELHLDDRALLRLAREPGGIPFGAIRMVGDDLDALAARMTEPALRDAVALHGVSLLASAGRRVGFEVRPLRRGVASELKRFFFVGLLAIYHPDGWRHVDRIRHALWPGELWMPASALRAGSHPGSMNG